MIHNLTNLIHKMIYKKHPMGATDTSYTYSQITSNLVTLAVQCVNYGEIFLSKYICVGTYHVFLCVQTVKRRQNTDKIDNK